MSTTEVFVYAGPGVTQESLTHSLDAFAAFQPELLFPENLLEGSWDSVAKLLVVPGGADRYYVSSLGLSGTKKIRRFVENGGGYLGICAGSYFAGSFCEFAKGTPLEICEERSLSLFNGTVRGPTLAPYSYEDQSGARAATLMCEKIPNTTAYYNGGGTFIGASSEAVMAYYEGTAKHPAIISSTFGRGRVVLSGVHIEYNPKNMDPDHPLIDSLMAGDRGRKDLLMELYQIFQLEGA